MAHYYNSIYTSAGQTAMKFGEEEKVTVTAGMMWHKVTREIKNHGMVAKVLSFIPYNENFEVMQVTLKNESEEEKTFEAIAAIPIYARSADDIRDHRHVTALLQRTFVTEQGVGVVPTFSFDERGHKVNDHMYYVLGSDGNGNKPVKFYPILEDYVGEGGTLDMPLSVVEQTAGYEIGTRVDGFESMGAFEFETVTLAPKSEVTYIITFGATGMKGEINQNEIEDNLKVEMNRISENYHTKSAIEDILATTKSYWEKEANVTIETGSKDFDGYMKWVSFQPVLRRVFGCSFLPHHDYGKGGRGWRDLWQDILALLLMGGESLDGMLLNNFAGIRMDGSNATIIGNEPGEFVADRNNITRVWMDHGLWPFMTTVLYIHQTGDLDILWKNIPYFKDKQVVRGTKIDEQYDQAQGVLEKTYADEVYEGSVLEHLLLQNVTAFYEVGEHNHMKLRGADWNDALDMAATRGESVAFTAAYAGNLGELAELLEVAKNRDVETISVLEEMLPFINHDQEIYDDIEKKNELLEAYCISVVHGVSGKKVEVSIEQLIKTLKSMEGWLKKHLRETEWLEEGWYNSYYDNHARAVEGVVDGKTRMMLTGQVFSIMSGTATDQQVTSIVKAADEHLCFPQRGGYALNTDFKEMKTDLGRMFGFAYGHKENGAVFSHMTTMFANALYKRGFAKEGFKALNMLFEQANDTDASKIYPGIPEYFNSRGRGMYHYLTGAASWYLLTVVTRMFGVRGDYGDLLIEPNLTKEQFDTNGTAKLSILFQNKNIAVEMENKAHLDATQYVIEEVCLNGKTLCTACGDKQFRITKQIMDALDNAEKHKITVQLK
ncbi:MAG: cellobiose phosphorylase [Lachnospiraceae bacterium]